VYGKEWVRPTALLVGMRLKVGKKVGNYSNPSLRLPWGIILTRFSNGKRYEYHLEQNLITEITNKIHLFIDESVKILLRRQVYPGERRNSY
jgi:hypothetical protein